MPSILFLNSYFNLFLALSYFNYKLLLVDYKIRNNFNIDIFIY